MQRPLGTLALAGAIGAFAFGAQAASFGPDSGAGVSVSGDEVTFAWEDTPFTGWIEFEAESSFDLFLNSASSSLDGEVTGWTLDAPGGVRLTNDTNFCSDAASPVGDGACNLVSNDDGVSGGFPVSGPDTSDPLFSGLASGDYILGIYESGSPGSGSLSFQVSETAPQVPLPAPAALLLGGLAVMGAARLGRKG